MVNWHYDMWTKCHVDKKTSRQNDQLIKCQLKMVNWQNDKWTKC